MTVTSFHLSSSDLPAMKTVFLRIVLCSSHLHEGVEWSGIFSAWVDERKDQSTLQLTKQIDRNFLDRKASGRWEHGLSMEADEGNNNSRTNFPSIENFQKLKSSCWKCCKSNWIGDSSRLAYLFYDKWSIMYIKKISFDSIMFDFILWVNSLSSGSFSCVKIVELRPSGTPLLNS